MDKTRKNRMTRLSTMLDGMVAPSVRKRGFVMSRLVSEWPVIAGDIAGWSRPSRLALQRDGGGKLTVAIRSGFGPLALLMRDWTLAGLYVLSSNPMPLMMSFKRLRLSWVS